MAKFAQSAQQKAPLAPTATVGKTIGHEGNVAYQMDAKTELYTLAISSFYGENSFYESAQTREARFTNLVHQVTKEDPAWIRAFIPWLRNDANIRSNAVAAACEYVAAGGENGRAVINGVCVRADEPAEVFGYWLSRHGRKIPAPVKRGLADACTRLYDEFNALKYDQSGSNVRMADVIDMCRPKPQAPWQSSLFKYLLDVRHKRDNPRGLENLETISNVLNWRSEALKGNVSYDLPNGVTWEALSAYTKMDKAAWEAMIPKMGYMALIRNLRNFEEAGISKEAAAYVNNFISDPDKVAQSRQLPFRFWSAYSNSSSLRYAQALEDAAQLSLSNMPKFPGRTLIMVDTSGSMSSLGYSAKSTVRPVSAAALFGSAVASASEQSSIYIYASSTAELKQQASILRNAQEIDNAIGAVGHGTATWPSVKTAWDQRGPFDRVMVFTDMQEHFGQATFIPSNVPVFVWDLGAYGKSNIVPGSNRYLLGGLSDQSFKMVKLLEDFKPAVWPWENAD